KQVKPLITDEPDNRLDHLAWDDLRLDRDTTRAGLSPGTLNHRGEAMVRFAFFLDFIDTRGEQRELLDHHHVARGGYSLLPARLPHRALCGRRASRRSPPGSCGTCCSRGRGRA